MKKIPRTTKFRVPDFMNTPWLTESYVMEHGFFPDVQHSLEDMTGTNIRFMKTAFGQISCLPRTEIRAGDIVIHDCYDEWEEDGKYVSDRFYTITQDEIQSWYESSHENIFTGTSLLPVGVVVHPPAEYGA